MATAGLAATEAPPGRIPRPELSAEQKRLILEATAELIRATVEGRTPQFADPKLGGATAKTVAGAFVSLKRGKHLRACCGGLQQRAVPLGKALYEAALRTALEDARFPPISPTEVAHLDVEVWLLYNPEPVVASGEERALVVRTEGHHGLVIERGPSRGLLLPCVAADHDWDARRFLEHTCIKAGLHPSLWKDDQTSVLTFEGDAVRGRVGDQVAAGGHGRLPNLVGRDHLRSYVGFCRDNIAALLAGATPTYYCDTVPDGTVSGIVLRLRRRGITGTLDLTQYSLRPGVPLQSTLFTMAQSLAQALAREGCRAEDLGRLDIGLTVLTDPAMHGTVANPELEGLDPRSRGTLVIERNKSGIAFNPGATAVELVAEAGRLAEALAPSSAAVFSLDVVSTEASVAVANVPRPETGPAVRPAGVAGKFYPAAAAELAEAVDQLLPTERTAEQWPAAMIPHAGLRFSGRVAAAVLSRLAIPPVVLVIGPKHTPLGAEWAVAPHETWSMPGFHVPSDAALAHKLADAIPGLALDALAHQHEHAIEVELPFLARLAPQSKVVGIAVGHGDLASCRRFADGLAAVLRECEPAPLLLISSDMNHFATEDENRRLDGLALDALETLDPERLYETVTENQISMCGVLPAVIVLEALKRLGRLTKAERVAYATSADVTGDTSRVVGYAGVLIG